MAFTPAGMFYLGDEDFGPGMDRLGAGVRGMLGTPNEDEAIKALAKKYDVNDMSQRESFFAAVRAINPQKANELMKEAQEFDKANLGMDLTKQQIASSITGQEWNKQQIETSKDSNKRSQKEHENANITFEQTQKKVADMRALLSISDLATPEGKDKYYKALVKIDPSAADDWFDGNQTYTSAQAEIAKNASISKILQPVKGESPQDALIRQSHELLRNRHFEESKNLLEAYNSLYPTDTSANAMKKEDARNALDYLEKTTGTELDTDETKYFMAMVPNKLTITASGEGVDASAMLFKSLIKNRGQNAGSNTNVIASMQTDENIKKEEEKTRKEEEKIERERLDKVNNQVTELSVALTDVSGAENALVAFEKKVAPYLDETGTSLTGDIPGLSKWEMLTRDAEGDAVSALWQNLMGEIRHKRFGSVLTKNEQKMFESIITGNWLALTDEAALEMVVNMRIGIDSVKKRIKQGYTPEVVSKYDGRKDFQELNSLIETAFAEGHTTDQIIEHLRKNNYSEAQINAHFSSTRGYQ